MPNNFDDSNGRIQEVFKKLEPLYETEKISWRAGLSRWDKLLLRISLW